MAATAGTMHLSEALVNVGWSFCYRTDSHHERVGFAWAASMGPNDVEFLRVLDLLAGRGMSKTHSRRVANAELSRCPVARTVDGSIAANGGKVRLLPSLDDNNVTPKPGGLVRVSRQCSSTALDLRRGRKAKTREALNSHV